MEEENRCIIKEKKMKKKSLSTKLSTFAILPFYT